ncbi:uncharacterized protein LOC134176113 isoform X2 [Corticium candelabrum]|uniref:uncharacterized protein LOC134176113 isoform X2 n=1 Tax=Corticium candelabrum TaxID=121492 RepID=UPI002E26B11D|nr:uncharacterized protein LOC134176113 isoform X2 [Corticium candelabrum]
MLLYDILPYKENAVDTLCEILKEAGQLHIVRDVMKRGGVVCADEPASNLQTVQQQQTIQQSEPNQQCDGLNGQEKSMTESVQDQQGSMTAPTEDNCTREREEDGTSGSTVEATTTSQEDLEVDSEWKERLKHCLPDLLAALRPSLFLDQLRGSNLISQEEHTDLQEKSLSETDRSDTLVSFILPRKGKGSFESFCKILCNVEKQKHIVSEILKVQNPSLLPVDANVSRSGETIGQSVKRKKANEHSSDSSHSKRSCVGGKIGSATFIFRKIDKEAVKVWKESIRKMCRKCFKISQKDVKFVYSLPPAGQVDSVFFGDSINKIALVHLDGVAPDRVESHKSRLVSFIARLMKVTENHIHYMEATKGSSLVLFQMRMDDYFRLFSALTVEAQCIALYQTLKWTFPELVGVKFRLGGLPAVELSNSRLSLEKVLMGIGSNLRTLRMNQTTMLSLSAISLQYEYMDMEKHVFCLYDIVDGVTDDLRNCDCRILTLQKSVPHAKYSSRQNKIVLDELGNDRIDHAVQLMVRDKNSVAACFRRMKLREHKTAIDVNEKLDVIKGLREEVETKLSQRPQLAELTACSHSLIEGLQARVVNLKLSKKMGSMKQQTEAMGEKWTNLALRIDKAQSVEEIQINDSLPSWTQWNVHMPHDSWSYNKMGEIEGRLVVGGFDGNLHVFTYKLNKWDKFVRKNGYIRNVVCHQGVCLVCVEDVDKDQFVIEQFYLNEDNKWRFLTVLPNKLRLGGVSVALHDNSLYVVGGVTKSGETVNTASVCDLHSGHWYKMDDMQTKRCYCSSVIINNTVFVGGGEIYRDYFSNIVECADVRDRKWRTIPSTTTSDSTLTSNYMMRDLPNGFLFHT